MKRRLAGWCRGCLINVSYSIYRLGKVTESVKAVWSAGITLSPGDCALTETPWSSDRLLTFTGETRRFFFSRWKVTWRKTRKRGKVLQEIPPHLDPSVSQEQRGTLASTAPQLSSLYSKMKFIWRSLDHTDDQLNYSPEFSLDKVSFIIKELSVLWSMRWHSNTSCLLMSHLLHSNIYLLTNYHGLFHFLSLCKWAVEVSWQRHWLCYDCSIPELCRPLHIQYNLFSRSNIKLFWGENYEWYTTI